jgi:RNA polymerase sigma-70 factor (ECF subfamily)
MIFAVISEKYTDLRIKKAQRGDEKAFCDLVRDMEPLVFNLAYRMLGNRQDAEDMAQEAFLRVYKALPAYRGEASFKNWTMRICKNVCLDELRRRSSRITAEEEIPETIADKTDVQAKVLAGERLRSLEEAINSLDERSKLLIVLRDINGLSYSAIAETMELELGTVKSAINRARKKLRTVVEEQNLL